MSAKELRQKRAGLWEQAKALVDQAQNEKRAMSAEETQQFDRLEKEMDELKGTIDRTERSEAMAGEMRAIPEPRAGRGTPASATTPAGDTGDNSEYRAAFTQYLRGGLEGLDPEQRSVLMKNYSIESGAQSRAQGTTTIGAGGALVPDEFHRELLEAMKEYGGMLEVATTLDTDTGADIGFPTSNDVNNEGQLLGENQPATEQDMEFAIVGLSAYIYSSKMVKLPLNLLQDSAFNLEGWLPGKLAERIMRIANRHWTVGDGANKPRGILNAASLGKTGANGQTTTATYEDLVDLEHSVDPAYRRNAGWMFNDSTLKMLKKMKDGENRPLWAPGITTREPDSILGYGYTINQDMPVMAASAKSILFGSLRSYMIRRVRNVQVMRLQERFAEYLQVAFLGFMRLDGDLIDAGVQPVKYYQNADS